MEREWTGYNGMGKSISAEQHQIWKKEKQVSNIQNRPNPSGPQTSNYCFTVSPCFTQTQTSPHSSNLLWNQLTLPGPLLQRPRKGSKQGITSIQKPMKLHKKTVNGLTPINTFNTFKRKSDDLFISFYTLFIPFYSFLTFLFSQKSNTKTSVAFRCFQEE